MPKQVPLQRYRPGLRVHQLLFFMQFMSRNLIRSCKVNPEALLKKAPGYLWIREAEIYYPQNGRTVLVTTQVCDADRGPFSADSVAGTYQVAMEHEQGHALQEATSEVVQRFLDDVPNQGWHMVFPHVKRTNYQITNLPDILYDPILHGRFLYSDEHNFDPNLAANRAMVGPDKWKTLSFVSQHLSREPKRDGAVIAVNQWCEEHCTDAYAWTCAGPIWAFTNPNDAFLFRIMWG